MERPRKPGWTEKGMIGMIFTPMGAFFMLIGTVLYAAGVGKDSRDSLFFLLIFGGIGGIFCLLGAVFLYLEARRRNGIRRAVERGETVRAKIIGVEQRTNVSFNGSHPYVVACQYRDPDSGVVHVWYSRYLRFDPEEMLNTDEVPVYYDRFNPEYAYVDIDAVLPEVAVHR